MARANSDSAFRAAGVTHRCRHAPGILARFSVSVRQPGGLGLMALFGAANSFRLIVLFLPNAMNNVGTSLLNNQRTASGDDYRRVFWWNLGLTATVVILGAAVVIAIGPLLLRAFGKEFQGGYAVLRILMLVAVIESLAIWTYQVIQSHGRMCADAVRRDAAERLRDPCTRLWIHAGVRRRRTRGRACGRVDIGPRHNLLPHEAHRTHRPQARLVWQTRGVE